MPVKVDPDRFMPPKESHNSLLLDEGTAVGVASRKMRIGESLESNADSKAAAVACP
jgi:hypothetical protein